MAARASDLSLSAADGLWTGTCAAPPAEIDKGKHAAGSWSFCAGILDVLLLTFGAGFPLHWHREGGERQLNGRSQLMGGEE